MTKESNVKNAMVVSLGSAVLATFLAPGAAFADQLYAVDSTWCRAGTVTVLAKSEGVIVWALDHRGVAQSKDVNDVGHGDTQRCMGMVSNIAGKRSGNGWCRGVDAKTGDWTLVDWTAGEKPGAGTWSYRFGVGKWKGVTGGGTYESLGQTRPVDPGTYQNCIRVKGTANIPG